MTPQQQLIQQHQVLETRLAGRLVGALTASSSALPHDLRERLRISREQAVATARSLRLNQTAGSVQLQNGGTATLSGPSAWWADMPEWLSALMPLVLLLAGLFLIEQLKTHEQIQVAADIDTQLLGDDLPPAAYADPGFVLYLRKGPAP